mgnify:CR=1 FL=1
MSVAFILNPTPKRGKGGRFVKGSHKKKASRKTHTAKRKTKRKTKRNPIMSFDGKRRRHYRRNQMGGIMGTLQSSVMPVAIGAGGALLTDLAIGYLPLPDTVKTGIMRPITKGGVAIGLGIIAGMLTSKATGAKVMAGALTVVVYSELKAFLQTQMPKLPLSGVEEYPALEFAGYGNYGLQDNMGELLEDSNMGELLDDSSMNGVGEYEDADFY